MSEDLYQLENPDGTHVDCTCGNDTFKMQQDKMPWAAVVSCTECGTLWLGCSPQTRQKAWLN